MKRRLYHCANRRLRVGDVLHKREGSLWCLPSAFLTTSPVPHHTIVERVLKAGPGRYHVYEVHVGGRLLRANWEDLAAPDRCEVVRHVGDARGILLNFLARERGITDKNAKAYLRSGDRRELDESFFDEDHGFKRGILGSEVKEWHRVRGHPDLTATTYMRRSSFWVLQWERNYRRQLQKQADENA